MGLYASLAGDSTKQLLDVQDCYRGGEDIDLYFCIPNLISSDLYSFTPALMKYATNQVKHPTK